MERSGSSEGIVSLEAILPHAHPMILIDEVIRIDGTSLQSRVRIAEDSMFYESRGGVPSYVGIEYIAQTVAAHAGMAALDKGEPVRVGFLLGTRRYTCRVPYFTLGALLTVRVSAVFLAPQISKFEGSILESGKGEVASCAVTVYLRDGAQGEP